MTTWVDVGRTIAPLAPTLGGLLAGLIPIPGASLIGSALGSVIAKQFGVEPVPEKVNEAILKTEADVAIAKLNAATEEARVKVQGFIEAEKAYTDLMKATVESTNVTMRAELGHEDFYARGWRSACGWLLVLYGFLYGAMLMVALGEAAFGAHYQPLQTLTEAWPAFLSFYGSLALIVGVYVWGRSAEKIQLIKAGEPPIPTTSPRTVKETRTTQVKAPVTSAKPTAPTDRFPRYDGEGRLINP